MVSKISNIRVKLYFFLIKTLVIYLFPLSSTKSIKNLEICTPWYGSEQYWILKSSCVSPVQESEKNLPCYMEIEFTSISIALHTCPCSCLGYFFTLFLTDVTHLKCYQFIFSNLQHTLQQCLDFLDQQISTTGTEEKSGINHDNEITQFLLKCLVVKFWKY